MEGHEDVETWGCGEGGCGGGGDEGTMGMWGHREVGIWGQWGHGAVGQAVLPHSFGDDGVGVEGAQHHTQRSAPAAARLVGPEP